MLRVPAGAIRGGRVAFNDRYAWEGADYAPLRQLAPLSIYAHDGESDYWAADLRLQPPRLRYRFGLETEEGLRWFGWDGLRHDPKPRGAFEFAYLAEGDRPDSPSWARGAVFYHIFPDRFARGREPARRTRVDAWDSTPARRTVLGGDLDGITERLDYIESLGADALYLTPIFTAPSNHKYDTADYMSVDPDFGGTEALDRLVAALHGRGMRLVLDGVFNHAGSTWPPFVDVLERGRGSRYARWFYFRDDGYETWGSKVSSLPKLRTSHPAVRELVLAVGRRWIAEHGIDGWRLDVANEVDHALWRAFRSAVRQASRNAFLVGEIWEWALPWLRGDQFDSVMNYPLRRAMLSFAGAIDLDGGGFLDAVDRLRAAYPEPVHDLLYNLLGSHDEVRPLTALRDDRAALVVAAGLLYTLPGIASLYYGDEVGMTGGKDPLNRGGMVWDPSRQDGRLLETFRSLGRLRRSQVALRTGRYTRLGADTELAIYARGTGRSRVIVAANVGESSQTIGERELARWLRAAPQVAETVTYSPAKASFRRGALHIPAQSVALITGGTRE